jgi:hypothetical protein
VIIFIVEVLPAPLGPRAERFAFVDVELDGVDGGEVSELLVRPAPRRETQSSRETVVPVCDKRRLGDRPKGVNEVEPPIVGR